MEQRLPDDILKHLEETFKGKRISVEDSKGIVWVGDCEFIGHNSFFPSWGLQVTLNRTPITNVKLSSIQIRETSKRIFK
jgi:hypothetical protein